MVFFGFGSFLRKTCSLPSPRGPGTHVGPRIRAVARRRGDVRGAVRGWVGRAGVFTSEGHFRPNTPPPVNQIVPVVRGRDNRAPARGAAVRLRRGVGFTGREGHIYRPQVGPRSQVTPPSSLRFKACSQSRALSNLRRRSLRSVCSLLLSYFDRLRHIFIGVEASSLFPFR